MLKGKSKFAKRALGYAVVFFTFLAMVTPASAAGVQFKDFDADTAVQEAPAEEVDKSALAAAIEEAAGLVEEDYTPETWSVFTAAFASAEAVLGDDAATQEAVDEALVELNSAMEALVEAAEEVDKSALAAAIEEAAGLDEADYTVKSWRKLGTALDAAKAVMEDDQATQKKVDKALAKLNKAMDALEKAKDGDETVVPIAIYQELLEAFTRLQNTYDKLLAIFAHIFDLSVLPQ